MKLFRLYCLHIKDRKNILRCARTDLLVFHLYRVSGVPLVQTQWWSTCTDSVVFHLFRLNGVPPVQTQWCSTCVLSFFLVPEVGEGSGQSDHFQLNSSRILQMQKFSQAEKQLAEPQRVPAALRIQAISTLLICSCPLRRRF